MTFSASANDLELQKTLVETEASVSEQVAADISARIQALELMSGENLKGEMTALKKALLDNPAACLLLKDEDIGSLVSSLRRITGVALSAASAKKTTKAGKTTASTSKFTKEQLNEALNSDEF